MKYYSKTSYVNNANSRKLGLLPLEIGQQTAREIAGAGDALAVREGSPGSMVPGIAG
jgi:hypothetical protein